MCAITVQVLVPDGEVLIQTPVKHGTTADTPRQFVHRCVDSGHPAFVFALDDRKDDLARSQDIHSFRRRRQFFVVGAQPGEVGIELQLLAGPRVVPFRAKRQREGDADGDDGALYEATPVYRAEIDEGGRVEVDDKVEEAADEGEGSLESVDGDRGPEVAVSYLGRGAESEYGSGE